MASTRQASSLNAASVVQDRSEARLVQDSLGWLGPLSLSSAGSLLLIAMADNAGRLKESWAESAWWVAIVILFVPIAWRLLSAEASRNERLGLVILLAMALYAIKILHGPIEFVFYDEFIHLRSTQDIESTGRLFEYNPLLPVSAYYPGLATVTAALGEVGHLPIYASGLLVLAAGRLLLVIGLFLTYERLSRSPKVAAFGVAIYMGNPSFFIVDAQFAYESMALPMFAFAFCLMALRVRSSVTGKTRLSAALLIISAALIATHHVTSLALIGFCLAWTMVEFCLANAGQLGRGLVPLISRCAKWCRGRMGSLAPKWLIPMGRHISVSNGNSDVGWLTMLLIVTVAAWSTYVAQLLVARYLLPQLWEGVDQLFRMIAGESGGRQLFRAYSGTVAPYMEQAVGISSVLLILLSLPIGWLNIWHRLRWCSASVTIGLLAALYPVSLLMRLTQAGTAAAGRSSAFLFVAVAFVSALAFDHVYWASGRKWYWRVAITCLAAVIFLGGIVIGWEPWQRLPGRYVVASEAQTIEPESTLAAEWVLKYLGPGHRLLVDQTNRLRMGSVGEQRPITHYADGYSVAQVLMSPTLGYDEVGALQSAGVQYVVVDRRLSTGLPLVGVFVEPEEPGAYHHTAPLSLAALMKFDDARLVDRVFDGGDIVIYDVRGLVYAP